MPYADGTETGVGESETGYGAAVVDCEEGGHVEKVDPYFGCGGGRGGWIIIFFNLVFYCVVGFIIEAMGENRRQSLAASASPT